MFARRSVGTGRWFATLGLIGLLAGLAWAADPPTKAPASGTQSHYKQWQKAYKAGDLKAADASAKQMLASMTSTYGRDNINTARTLYEYARLHCDLGRFNGGLSAAKQALTIREKLQGKNDPSVAEACVELTRISLLMFDNQGAERYIARAAEIYKAKKETRPILLAEVELYQALILSRQYKLDGVVDQALAAMATIEKAATGNESTLIRALKHLALIYLRADNLAQAEEAAQKAVAQSTEYWGEAHPETLACRYVLAQTLSQANQQNAAETQFERLLADAERVLGPNHLLVSHVLHDQGLSALNGQELTRAEALLLRARKIKEQALGAKSFDVAVTLQALGNVKMQARDFKGSRELIDAALAIVRDTVGEEHPFAGSTWNSLANCLAMNKDEQGALNGYLKSIEIADAALKPGSKQAMTPMRNIALLYLRTNRPADAEAVLRDAMTAVEKRYGADSRELVWLMALLSKALPALNKSEELSALYARAEKILAATGPSDSPDLVWILEGKAQLANRKQKTAEARDSLDRAQKIMHKHVTGVLTSLSESAVNSFIRDEFNPVFNAAVALTFTNMSDKDFVGTAASWVINGKGLGTQALAERALQGREIQTSDPALRKDAADLRRTREQLASLIMLTIGSPKARAALNEKISSLQKTQTQLVDKLALALGDQAQAIKWTEAADVQAKVPEGSALIEIVRVRRQAANGSLPYYVGFVIPHGKAPVQAFDLGPAPDLDAVCLQFAELMQTSAALIDRVGEAKAESLIADLMDDISERVLKPMMPALRETPDWIVSPDGPMWMIPWAALRVNKQYVATRYRVRYVVSSRDLLAAPVKAEVGKAVIFSNPDYFAGIKVPKGYKLKKENAPFQPLPGSLVETKAITPAVTKWCGGPPVVRLGAAAREAAVKEVASPRLLMLSTHGFFFGFAGQPGLDENPLLSCGLAFAGANDRKLDSSIRKDDGILTGMEVMSLDLRGSEMVVLSACETAKGQPQAGEGVAGLRYAFHMAGAKNVVSTLWSIPDQETAYLMQYFFDAVAEGKPHQEALQIAQTKAISERKKGGGTSHPFFWAAFALSQRGS